MEEVKGQQSPGIKPNGPGMSQPFSTTELRPPDNHQPHNSLMSAQVVLNTSVAHLTTRSALNKVLI